MNATAFQARQLNELPEDSEITNAFREAALMVLPLIHRKRNSFRHSNAATMPG